MKGNTPMFEEASRRKLRFESPFGRLSVEDIWDLPLDTLDSIAVGLYQKTQNENISFVKPEQKTDVDLQLRFDIVRRIIEVKLQERTEAEEKILAAQKKQRLLAILARKEDAELESSSTEELRRMINEL
jgi:hypothetical protein